MRVDNMIVNITTVLQIGERNGEQVRVEVCSATYAKRFDSRPRAGDCFYRREGNGEGNIYEFRS